MEIYVYSDESGVFDVKHYDTFVFSGLVFTDISKRDSAARRLLSLEKKLRNKEVYKNTPELKAGKTSRKDRELLYTTVNTYDTFAVVINQDKLDAKHIFADKKSKQRYINYAYKCLMQYTMANLLNKKTIPKNEPITLNIVMDSRPATEEDTEDLRLAIIESLKYGSYDAKGKFVKPIIQNLEDVTVQYKDSEATPLVRAADIVANKVFSVYRKDKLDSEYNDNIEQDFIAFLQLP